MKSEFIVGIHKEFLTSFDLLSEFNSLENYSSQYSNCKFDNCWNSGHSPSLKKCKPRTSGNHGTIPETLIIVHYRP